MDRELRDRSGNLAATIKSKGNRDEIYDRRGNFLGYFDGRDTYDRIGNRIGQGDWLSSLVKPY